VRKSHQQPPPPIPPTISPSEGKRRFQVLREKGSQMAASGAVSDDDSELWANTAIEHIKATFGSESPHIYTFLGQQTIRVSGLGGGYDERVYMQQNAREVNRRVLVLDRLVEQIDVEASFSTPDNNAQGKFDPWVMLHPDIVQHSRPRYEAGHFADAVEAAFKHINTKVKDLVFRKSGKEHDGASLMRHAFSPNNPLIVLEDLSAESGKNVQQGYMDIFAGSMVGIRNPKAHANVQIDAKRAMHLLFLASLLMHRFDERI
jgi:uncharacterized protein (TIGR02391 family)